MLPSGFAAIEYMTGAVLHVLLLININNYSKYKGSTGSNFVFCTVIYVKTSNYVCYI